MLRFKLWILLFSALLIILDKFSFISQVRDSAAIFIQQQINFLVYPIKNYPKLVLLQKNKQLELENENIQLKKQVEQDAILLKQQHNQGVAAQELETLKAESGLYNNFHVVLARAIIDINYLMSNKLLIDQGSNAAITPGNAVVNKDGVVGQITNANSQNAQVMLITNPYYKIYLQSKVSGSKMLAQGSGNNYLAVKYISKNEKIKAGDILLTTGLDDIYPANIPVARVTKVFYENNGFNSALCEPVIDFNKLQYILVLKNAN